MFTKVLVPLDHSELAEQALGPAAAIARGATAGIDVVLVHEPLPFTGARDPWIIEQVVAEDRYLESIVGELASGTSVRTTHAVLRGSAIEMVVARAHDVNADLIVMTSHGRTGLSRAWMGSVADGVLRASSIPVLMLRPRVDKPGRSHTQRPFRRILVPVEDTVFSHEILSPAMDLARVSDGRITLLHVVQPVPMIPADGLPIDANVPLGAGIMFGYQPMIVDDAATTGLVEESRARLDLLARGITDLGIEVDADVLVGSNVAERIITFARGHAVDLIAMTTHGRGAARVLMGSVADKVIRASGLPMLLHRPKGVAHPGARVSRGGVTRAMVTS